MQTHLSLGVQSKESRSVFGDESERTLERLRVSIFGSEQEVRVQMSIEREQIKDATASTLC